MWGFILCLILHNVAASHLVPIENQVDFEEYSTNGEKSSRSLAAKEYEEIATRYMEEPDPMTENYLPYELELRDDIEYETITNPEALQNYFNKGPEFQINTLSQNTMAKPVTPGHVNAAMQTMSPSSQTFNYSEFCCNSENESLVKIDLSPEQEVSLTSSNFSDSTHYPHNCDCGWVVQVPEGYILKIECPTFKLGAGDEFVIKDKCRTLRFSGSSTVSTSSRDNIVKIMFASDQSDTNIGFDCYAKPLKKYFSDSTEGPISVTHTVTTTETVITTVTLSSTYVSDGREMKHMEFIDRFKDRATGAAYSEIFETKTTVGGYAVASTFTNTATSSVLNVTVTSMESTTNNIVQEDVTSVSPDSAVQDLKISTVVTVINSTSTKGEHITSHYNKNFNTGEEHDNVETEVTSYSKTSKNIKRL